VDPVLDKAPILNTTAEAWTPLEFWGAGKVGSSNLTVLPHVPVHDPLTEELAKEVQVESEHRRNPRLSQAPKVSVGLSHSSSSRVRAPGMSQANSVDMQDAEFHLMGELLRNATNFFAFEGSLVLTAVQLDNLHHIHAIEADPQALDSLLAKPEVQNAMHQGKLVLTGQPLEQDNLFNSVSQTAAAMCVPSQVKGAFEAEWDLIFMGKDCSTDAVVKTLEATSSNARVAVLGSGQLSEESLLESCDKVRVAGSLTVFVRKSGLSPGSEADSKPEEEESSWVDALAPLAHGEGFWPH
jgi:hypothetical protein